MNNWTLVHHFNPYPYVNRLGMLLLPNTPFGPIRLENYASAQHFSYAWEIDEVELCYRGFHGSVQPVFALGYAVLYPYNYNFFDQETSAVNPIYWNPRFLSGNTESDNSKMCGSICYWPIGSVDVTRNVYDIAYEIHTDLRPYAPAMYRSTYVDLAAKLRLSDIINTPRGPEKVHAMFNEMFNETIVKRYEHLLIPPKE